MTLISRSLSCQSCKNILFSPNIRSSFHQYNCKILLLNSQLVQTLPYLQQHYQSTNKGAKKDTLSSESLTGTTLNQRARLKQAFRDYGATIVVFHVAISLTSLGLCYIAVSNGVDAVALLQRFGFPESVISNKVAIGGSTFVMSYAVHKLLAPVRIGITLFSAPFIVRYLRSIKFIKPPK